MKNKRLSHTLGAVLALSLGAVELAYAYSDVDSLRAGYGKDEQGSMIKNPPSTDLAKISGILKYVKNAAQNVNDQSKQQTNDFVTQFLSVPSNADKDVTRLAFCVPGSDINMGNSAIAGFIQDKCKVSSNMYLAGGSTPFANNPHANNAFNANLLLSDSLYTNDQLTSSGDLANPMALDYLRYLSGTTNPPNFPYFISKSATYDEGKKVDSDDSLSDPVAQQYLLNLRGYASELSAGLNTLFYLYNERLPSIPLDATSAVTTAQSRGLKTITRNGGTWTSKLALEEYMATWRVHDRQKKGDDNINNLWRETIQKGDTITLQRELAYIAAEQLYETYQLHQSMERLSVTLAGLELAMLRQQRDGLDWNATTQKNEN